MSGFLIEPAKPGDSPALCRLVRLAAMPGSVSISMEREPDYFLAAGVQGEKTSVFVARSAATGGLAGVGALSLRYVYVNGKPREIPYLSDLRIAPEFRKGRLLAQAYAYLREHLLSGNAFAQTIVVEDNAEALALLTSGRAGLPHYFPFGEYASPAILMAGAVKSSGPYEIVRADGSQARSMQSFYDVEAPRRQFQPCYAFPDMGGVYGRDLSWGDYFLAYRNGTLVGMAGVWDQRNFKQTRIQAYGGALKWLRPAVNVFSRWAGAIPLPPAGSLLPYLNLHAIAIKGDDPEILAALLSGIRRELRGQGHAYLLCGLDKQDPLRRALTGFKTRHFGGRHFLVGFGEDPRCGLRPGPFYLEAARI
jgi:hypothetical protein